MDGSSSDRQSSPRHVSPDGAHDAHAAPESDHLFWRRFAEAATPKAFCQSWLPLQCRMLDGVRCAVVLLGPADAGPYAPVAVWPDAKLRMHHLTGTAERALKERRGLMAENSVGPGADNPYGEAFQIAYPIDVSGRLHGVVVLGVADRPREDLQRIMRTLHWGAAWLEVLIRRTEETRQAAVAGRMETALDLMASAVEHQKAHAAGMALATRMADRLHCDRVSIGFAAGRRVRVWALSHSAEAGERSNLMRAVGAAMDEAVDQRAAVAYPLPEEGFPFVVRTHEALSRQFNSGAVLTVPFQYEGEIIGALTLERDKERPFDPDTVELCETDSKKFSIFQVALMPVPSYPPCSSYL